MLLPAGSKAGRISHAAFWLLLQAPMVAFEDTQTDVVDTKKVYTTGVTVMEYNANDNEW